MITKINDCLKQAMKDKNTSALNAIRALKTAITNSSLTKGNVNEPLSDVEILGLVRKQIAQREDSIKQYRDSKRDDVTARILIEEEETQVLKAFLPAEWSDDELNSVVSEVIINLNASSNKDMGKVIKEVQLRANGKADNKRISKSVGDSLQ